MESSVRGVPWSPDVVTPLGGDATDAPDPVALAAWAQSVGGEPDPSLPPDNGLAAEPLVEPSPEPSVAVAPPDPAVAAPPVEAPAPESLASDPPTLEPEDRASLPAPSMRFSEVPRARAVPPPAAALGPVIRSAIAPMAWAVGGILGFLVAVAGGIVWSRLHVAPEEPVPVVVEVAPPAPPVVVPPVVVEPVVAPPRPSPVVVAAPVEESPRKQRRRARREKAAADAPVQMSDGSASAEESAGKAEKKPFLGIGAKEKEAPEAAPPAEDENPWGI